jgi:hypothetical protein
VSQRTALPVIMIITSNRDDLPYFEIEGIAEHLKLDATIT